MNRLVLILLLVASGSTAAQAPPSKLQIPSKPGKGLVFMSVTVAPWREPLRDKYYVATKKIDSSGARAVIHNSMVLDMGYFKARPSEFADVHGGLVVEEFSVGEHEVTRSTVLRVGMINFESEVSGRDNKPLRFHVAEGKATYIGNFHVTNYEEFIVPKRKRGTSKGFWYLRPMKFGFQDGFVDRDLALFKSKYPNIPADKIELSIPK